MPTPHWNSAAARERRLLPLLLLVACALAKVADAADPFDCEHHQCGLPGNDIYPNIVIGRLTAVASRDDALRILRANRKRGWWASLPDNNDDEYLNSIALVSIQSTPAQPVTVTMTPQELANAPMSAGDLVRYTPHTEGFEKPPYQTPHAEQYYALTGCVAVLCRASDKACFVRYRPGIYRLTDGAEIDLHGNKPLVGGARINPTTMVPVAKKE